jgi:hypothetical protein
MGEGHPSGNRLSVYETADAMGVTVDAIRKRVSRGTIPHEKGDDGRVWIILDTDRYSSGNVRDTDRPQSDASALTSQMQSEIDYLRGQLESERQAHAEARRIIAGLVERIPALEPPGEPETPSEPVQSTPGTRTGDTRRGAPVVAQDVWDVDDKGGASEEKRGGPFVGAV